MVHDVKIIEGNDGCFIAMPSKKTPEGEYKDIVHPLNTETREMLGKIILAEYDKAKAAAENAGGRASARIWNGAMAQPWPFS